MSRRPEYFEAERMTMSYDHGALTGDTTVKLWKCPAGRKFKLERASYINPTGLVGDATDAFAGYVKKGATVMATLFNTDTGDAGGASLAADTFVEGALSATPADLWLDAADIISFLADEDGTQTLPAGRLVLEGYLY